MKRLTLLSGVFYFTFFTLVPLTGQNEKIAETKLDSIVVEAYRADRNTPVSHTFINREQLKQSSPVHSVPMLLSLMPSVVASTEGGNGLGYSSLRIRGSEASRINVTLNGIALNDAESQQVFWVNIPSFSTFLQDIQVQRGVGTSSNGPGAFGGSINMKTLHTSREPYGVADFAAGSYRTFISTAGAGTGLLSNGLSFDIRYSRNLTDGYIRNAKADLTSLYASVGWYRGDNALKFNYIFGDQKTGITWEGISRQKMEVDRRYNPAGLFYDAAGNVNYYDNETDNYTQHHYQLIFSHSFTPSLTMSSTLHLTNGDGYYQNYKMNRRFSSYGLPPQLVGGKVYSRSDVILRQSLSNTFTAVNSNLKYYGDVTEITAGLSYSYYHGDHFGNLLKVIYNENIPDNYQWYFNSGFKSDFSTFVRSEVNMGDHLVMFADIQVRSVKYTLRGDDKDFVSLNWDRTYTFLNPKAGFTLNFRGRNQFYASIAVAGKEPGRSDIKESIKAHRADEILPERLLDYEFGYRYSGDKLKLSANIYLMEYNNQLVPTGKLSETGYVIKENVKESHRRGVEMMAEWSPFKALQFNANITLSRNVIKNYTQYLDQFDSNWSVVSQKELFFDRTRIAFSPPVTSLAMVSINPFKNTSFSLYTRYVGRQYLDNTSDLNHSVPSYVVSGLNCMTTFEMKKGRYVDIMLFIDNLFNNLYFSNGWIYRAEFTDGTPYAEEGIYPQAERNFTLRVSFRF